MVLGIPCLNHEILDYPVEYAIVVVLVPGVGQEVLAGLRTQARVHFDQDFPHRCCEQTVYLLVGVSFGLFFLRCLCWSLTLDLLFILDVAFLKLGSGLWLSICEQIKPVLFEGSAHEGRV